MRGMIRRSLRLELVAGLGIALATPALVLAADSSQTLATQTTLATETRDQGGRTQATFTVSVTGADGLPASGAVVINDQGRPWAGVALNVQGQAKVVLALPVGDHLLSAVYNGDATHKGSISMSTGVHGQASAGAPSFGITVAPATLSVTAGQSGTVTASVTPVDAASLSAPMFVTLSCSGLPDQSSCTFTPENVEILPGATAVINSSMVLQTQAASSTSASSTRQRSNPVSWAFLLPGALVLVGMGWGGRGWVRRFSLLALVGLVTVLGTTACNPRYYYLNHGPPTNPATPAGTYTVIVDAQTSNGVTATTQFTTFALTVK